MNTIKTYKIANRKKGQVEYGSRPGGTWKFRVGKFIKITKVKGGRAVADKIAEAMHKSWLRTDGKIVKDDSERIDGICRSILDRLTKGRTLTDYKGEPEWWSNRCLTNPAVDMISPFREIPKGISAEDLNEDLEPATEPVIELAVA